MPGTGTNTDTGFIGFNRKNYLVTPDVGMGWFKMPLNLWALYATAIIQVLATPVLAITLLLLACERLFGLGIFDPALGGNPVLFQHFFWFYSHPAVYVMIIPAMGVISELIAAFSRKPIFGYKFVAFSSVGIAVLGFLVWAHHMFTTGMSVYAATFFSVLTMLIAVPTAVKVINWTTTMYRGAVAWETVPARAEQFHDTVRRGGLDFRAQHMDSSHTRVCHLPCLTARGTESGTFST